MMKFFQVVGNSSRRQSCPIAHAGACWCSLRLRNFLQYLKPCRIRDGLANNRELAIINADVARAHRQLDASSK